jgi:hypothetical protein
MVASSEAAMDDRSTGKIPILIVTDCEPDLRQPVPGTAVPWTGFERYFEFLSEKRAWLSERTGAPAHFSWFWRLDPQIAFVYGSADWPLRTYARQIEEAKRCGDEAGVHVHAWRWSAAAARWVADFGNDPWVENCVQGALREYERAWGESCRIFSFGDGWHNQMSVALIERLGIRIDLTMEPGCEASAALVPSERSTGIIPDRRKVPDRPYRPSPVDFLQPDREGQTRLWFLPMSTGIAPTAAKPEVIKLNLAYEPERFMPIFEQALSKPRPYAAIAVRTDVGADAGLLRYVGQNLQSMLDHRLADRFAFRGPTEALSCLVDLQSA